MNGVRIFLALALTLVAAMSWRNVLMRVELDHYADAQIALAESLLGRPFTPREIAPIRATVARGLPMAALLPPALITSASSALAWALAIYAARRAERAEAAG